MFQRTYVVDGLVELLRFRVGMFAFLLETDLTLLMGGKILDSRFRSFLDVL